MIEGQTAGDQCVTSLINTLAVTAKSALVSVYYHFMTSRSTQLKDTNPTY